MPVSSARARGGGLLDFQTAYWRQEYGIEVQVVTRDRTRETWLSMPRHGYACSKWLSALKPPNIYSTVYLLAAGRIPGPLGRDLLLINSFNQVYLLISLPGEPFSPKPVL